MASAGAVAILRRVAEDLVFTENETVEERAFDYARTVALSDGVFAIALTLLVLNITVPTLDSTEHSKLGHVLLTHRSEFVSYAISFAVISIFWIRHHVFFRGLDKIDARLTVINLAYLAFVAFVPYPTRLMGLYGDVPASVVLYAATLGILAGLAGLARAHALRARLLTPVGLREVEGREHWLFAPVIFLVSIPIAFLSPTAAQFVWVLILLPNVGQRMFGSRSGRRAPK
jgi:uncharacterized membrane protein